MAAIEKLKLLASRKAPDRPSSAVATDVAPADRRRSADTVGYQGGVPGRPLSSGHACRLLCGGRDRLADRARLRAQPRAAAGDANARAGPFAARDCGHAIILLLFGTLGGLGTALSGPATSWAQKLPTGIPKLQERLSFLSRPIAAFQKFADQAQGLTRRRRTQSVPVAVQGSGLSDRLLSGTRSFASGLLETVLVLFFLLVSGDTFLRRLVEILPRFKTSDRRSTSRSRSRATYRPTSLRLRS